MSAQPLRILFVCLGNICRSPAAESVFNSLIEQQNIKDRFYVESAGTGGWHVGELPDARMRRHGEKRGLKFVTPARQFVAKDFSRFDHIVVMDDANYRDVLKLAASADDRAKVVKMATFHSQFGAGKMTEVPDPYYGGPEGFELVLDILGDACSSFLKKLMTP